MSEVRSQMLELAAELAIALCDAGEPREIQVEALAAKLSKGMVTNMAEFAQETAATDDRASNVVFLYGLLSAVSVVMGRHILSTFKIGDTTLGKLHKVAYSHMMGLEFANLIRCQMEIEDADWVKYSHGMEFDKEKADKLIATIRGLAPTPRVVDKSKWALTPEDMVQRYPSIAVLRGLLAQPPSEETMKQVGDSGAVADVLMNMRHNKALYEQGTASEAAKAEQTKTAAAISDALHTKRRSPEEWYGQMICCAAAASHAVSHMVDPSERDDDCLVMARAVGDEIADVFRQNLLFHWAPHLCRANVN